MIPTGLSFKLLKGPYPIGATQLRVSAEMMISPRSAAELSFPPAQCGRSRRVSSPSATVVGLLGGDHGAGPGPTRAALGVQVCQHRADPAMGVLGGGQVEFGEDA